MPKTTFPPFVSPGRITAFCTLSPFQKHYLVTNYDQTLASLGPHVHQFHLVFMARNNLHKRQLSHRQWWCHYVIPGEMIVHGEMTVAYCCVSSELTGALYSKTSGAPEHSLVLFLQTPGVICFLKCIIYIMYIAQNQGAYIELLLTKIQVHATLKNASVLPRGVVNHGIVSSQEYQRLLNSAKVWSPWCIGLNVKPTEGKHEKGKQSSTSASISFSTLYRPGSEVCY